MQFSDFSWGFTHGMRRRWGSGVFNPGNFNQPVPNKRGKRSGGAGGNFAVGCGSNLWKLKYLLCLVLII